jgi:hypothetical protein
MAEQWMALVAAPLKKAVGPSFFMILQKQPVVEE